MVMTKTTTEIMLMTTTMMVMMIYVDDDDVNGDNSEAPHVMRMRAWRSARLGICGRLERGILTLGHSSDNPGLLFSDTPTLKQIAFLGDRILIRF